MYKIKLNSFTLPHILKVEFRWINDLNVKGKIINIIENLYDLGIVKILLRPQNHILGKIVDAFDYIKINHFSLVYTTVDWFNSWHTGRFFFQCAKHKRTNS